MDSNQHRTVGGEPSSFHSLDKRSFFGMFNRREIRVPNRSSEMLASGAALLDGGSGIKVLLASFSLPLPSSCDRSRQSARTIAPLLRNTRKENNIRLRDGTPRVNSPEERRFIALGTSSCRAGRDDKRQTIHLNFCASR